MNNDVICSIEDLRILFPIKRGILQHTCGYVKAIDGVSIQIERGSILGLVGESGCGKTTLGRSLVRLNEPTSGRILYNGVNILELSGHQLKQVRREIQMIFQDPYSSLNPRFSINQMLTEILTVRMGYSKADAAVRLKELLIQVGLSPSYVKRYPHEFSGGQRQRLAIAKSIALQPKLVVCDEAVSALDVSVQSQVINLLMELRETYKMTYLFISHAMNVVEYVCDYVAVLYLGKVVEYAATEEIFNHAVHPYTKALIASVPKISIEKKQLIDRIAGELPSITSLPSGCRFHSRCPFATQRCFNEEPDMREYTSKHFAACHNI